MKKVFVFGHKNPDTDSVCSAIALAYLKNQIGLNCIPKVIGPINNGTMYVLRKFNVEAPSYLNDVRVQISDIKYRKKSYINIDDSIENAFNYMKENRLTALPLVDNNKKLKGYVSLKDLAKYLVSDKRDTLKTNLKHLLKTLNAKIITNFQNEFSGPIKAVTFASDTFINEVKLTCDDILIVGDRFKVLEHAINSKVQLIILARDLIVPLELLNKATENKVSIITSSYLSYDLCNKISLANFIETINATNQPTCVNIDDYYTDFLSLSRRYNYTNYPIIKKNGECLGVLKITDASNYDRKKVILVDHNNYEQSVEGLEEAEIVEILDHHNLGSIGTSMPISFTSRPVGCTATIVYDEFKKERVEIPQNIAGLLLSAIISDTLLFTSPTTTFKDKLVASDLSKIAKVDIKDYGIEMLKAASSIKGLSVSELIMQDFKSYSINDKDYGIAVITTMDFDQIEKEIDKYVEKLNEMSQNAYESVLIFITDIMKEGSYILYNDNSKNLLMAAFNLENIYEGIFIPGLMSRKKQILPALMQELDN